MTLLVAGILGLALAFWGLFADVGFLAQPFYAYAWWSSILALDGLTALRRKSSILTSRRALLPPLLVWSVTFWFLFELLNLRFQNWYYVGVFARGMEPDVVRGAIFGVVSFATVFLGLFETFDALGGEKGRTRTGRMPSIVSYAVQTAGGLMVALALLFPYYLAPLVWGSVSFLLDPWNHRRGARSLLSDVEARNLRTPARLLLAGLLCGLLWESFNYFAPQKWIYTVRGLEGVKLFEMPLLGFLGFPALALDAFAFFAFVSYWFHGNRTWENPDDAVQKLSPRKPLPRWAHAASLPVHLAFWIAVSLSIRGVNVGSIALELKHLRSLPPEAPAILEQHGIARPGQLLRALEDSALLPAGDWSAVEAELRLLSHKGIGPHHGELLRKAGIGSVEELALASPDELFRELEQERALGSFPPLRAEMVRVWVDAARRLETR